MLLKNIVWKEQTYSHIEVGKTTLIKPLSFDEIQCKIEYYNISRCDNAELLHCHMVFKKQKQETVLKNSSPTLSRQFEVLQSGQKIVKIIYNCLHQNAVHSFTAIQKFETCNLIIYFVKHDFQVCFIFSMTRTRRHVTFYFTYNNFSDKSSYDHDVRGFVTVPRNSTYFNVESKRGLLRIV